MPAYQDSRAESRVIDYDFHGIVGLRLVNPCDRDLKAVIRQIGYPADKPLKREPDIIVHFYQDLPTPKLTYLGLHSGYTTEEFYILKSAKAPAKVSIPFETIGDRCEIKCQSGIKSVPLLIAIINMTFLRKNILPLHASAFIYDDVPCIVTGWAKGGKTESLLSFRNHGAKYVTDEWTLFSTDGERMFGVSEPIRLWQWHFEHIPNIHRDISPQSKFLFKAILLVDSIHKRLKRSRLKKFSLVKLMDESLPALKRQLNIRITPRDLFGERLQESAIPEKVFLVMSHSDSSIKVEPCDPLEIAERMINSNRYEFMPFFEYYNAFKFAFPHRQNEFLESIDRVQRALLHQIFQGMEAYKVLHPYPVAFEALYEKMKPFCARRTSQMIAQN